MNNVNDTGPMPVCQVFRSIIARYIARQSALVRTGTFPDSLLLSEL